MSLYSPYQQADGRTIYGAAAMNARVKQMGGMQKRDDEQYLAGYRRGYADRDSEVGEEMQQLRQQVGRLEDTVNRLSQQFRGTTV